MGFASMTTFAALQVLLLFLGSVNAENTILMKDHDHHYHTYHAHSPMHAPAPGPSHYHHYHTYHAHSPMHAPAPGPSHYHHYYHSHHPFHPPTSHHYAYSRKRVAVEGVVYCKSCKYSGSDTLTNATAISGAMVKLQCNNIKHSSITEATTDKNGYFYIEAPKTVSSYGVRRCKAFLVSSPSALCSKATNLNEGMSGATLRYEKTKTHLSGYALHRVGPFAFEPPKC